MSGLDLWRIFVFTKQDILTPKGKKISADFLKHFFWNPVKAPFKAFLSPHSLQTFPSDLLGPNSLVFQFPSNNLGISQVWMTSPPVSTSSNISGAGNLTTTKATVFFQKLCLMRVLIDLDLIQLFLNSLPGIKQRKHTVWQMMTSYVRTGLWFSECGNVWGGNPILHYQTVTMPSDLGKGCNSWAVKIAAGIRWPWFAKSGRHFRGDVKYLGRKSSECVTHGGTYPINSWDILEQWKRMLSIQNSPHR